MCRGWKGLALVAACWWLGVPAQAQEGTYPSPVGAARMPQPIPCGPSTAPTGPQPNLIQGPISPQAAPMGPPDCLDLPYDHTSAFQCENFVKECGFYADLGPIALQRNHLGAGDIAVVNSHAVGLNNGASIIPNPFIPPPPGIIGALNFNNVSPPLSLGILGTLGYLWDSQAVEVSAFYIWEHDTSKSANMPFSLDTLFYNPPIAFIGAGMLRYADSATLNFGSSLFNSEVNYRRWNNAFLNSVDFIFGARYVRENDILSIQSQGTALLDNTNALGLPSPGANAFTYSVIAHNNIAAPQVGLEWNLPIFKWLHLSLLGKGAWGVNYLTTDVNLTRSDGLTAFNTTRHATVFAQVYQLGAFADITLLEKMRLRLGYSAFWLTGVAAAVDQVDFDLKGTQSRQSLGVQGLTNALQSGNLKSVFAAESSFPHGNVNNNGSMLFFGPQIQLQVAF
ncbi:MAG TPA: hypothetical protein VH592_04175 [Gemmataceae bacterium]